MKTLLKSAAEITAPLGYDIQQFITELDRNQPLKSRLDYVRENMPKQMHRLSLVIAIAATENNNLKEQLGKLLKEVESGK